jgi:predicted metal-dependent hydrolase
MKYWCDNSPIWTHFTNAMSILFPAWERAFVDVIDYYLPIVNNVELRNRMIQFQKEEISHANAHHAYNKKYNLIDMEELEFKKTKIIARKPHLKLWLGTMVSIEHIAACLSRLIINRWMEKDGKNYKLFCWHAKEELSHKSLALDLWVYLGNNHSDLKIIAKKNQKYVLSFLIKYTIQKTYADKKFVSCFTIKDFFVWLFLMIKYVALQMHEIYAPSFHPNKKNDNHYLGVA